MSPTYTILRPIDWCMFTGNSLSRIKASLDVFVDTWQVNNKYQLQHRRSPASGDFGLAPLISEQPSTTDQRRLAIRQLGTVARQARNSIPRGVGTTRQAKCVWPHCQVPPQPDPSGHEGHSIAICETYEAHRIVRLFPVEDNMSLQRFNV